MAWDKLKRECALFLPPGLGPANLKPRVSIYEQLYESSSKVSLLPLYVWPARRETMRDWWLSSKDLLKRACRYY